MNVQDIKDKKIAIERIYAEVREAQKLDQSYYDDTFPVKEVHEPHHIYRSGLGTRIIDAPAEQIVTSHPQAFVESGRKDFADKAGKVLNEAWLPIMRRQNPNPFKETVKNPLLRGETFIQVGHYENPGIMPVWFAILDPMVVYASPEEDENGVPNEVFVIYERNLDNIAYMYPDWKNLLNKSKEQLVSYWAYWNKEQRYFEADGEALLSGDEGLQPNIYGIVPFVRRYSGFGRRSPDGKLTNLIVSDIKRSHDLLLEECAMRSNIASIQYLFAHKDLLITSEGELNTDQLKEMQLGAYTVNSLSKLPPNTKIELGLSREMGQVSSDTLQHHRDIIMELNQRHPFIMAGWPLGSSGRQDDMAFMSAMRRYESVVENTETMWATAFEMAFKVCKTAGKIPKGMSKEDLSADYKCTVRLKADDPLEDDRRKTLGSRMWNGGTGAISLYTNLTEYHKMTPQEAKKEIGRMLAEKVTIQNPDIAAMLGSIGAKEGGIEVYLEQMKNQLGRGGLTSPPTKSGTQRVQGEVETQLGTEMGTEGVRGARQSPEGYNRG